MPAAPTASARCSPPSAPRQTRAARAYSGMLSDLSPGVVLAPAAQLQAGLTRFNSGLMSCPVFSGTDALTSETDCAWAQVTGRSTQQTADEGTSGFSNDSITYQVGGQHEVAPGWFVGMSAAYRQSWLDAYDDRVNGDGNSGYLGLTVKREIGPWHDGRRAQRQLWAASS